MERTPRPFGGSSEVGGAMDLSKWLSVGNAAPVSGIGQRLAPQRGRLGRNWVLSVEAGVCRQVRCALTIPSTVMRRVMGDMVYLAAFPRRMRVSEA